MRVVFFSFFIILMSCSTSKNVVNLQNLEALKEVVANKNFEVISDWAKPLSLNTGVTGLQNLMPPGSTTNNISLIGNSNFFKVLKDSVFMELPYFGQQRIPRGYNVDSGIKFHGKIDTYKESFNKKKNAFVLEYNLDGKDEDYRVILTLFSNHSSSLSINSSHRTSINYDGKWKKI